MPNRKTETVTSTRNRKVVEARKLEQRKHRQQQARFIVEGLPLLHLALSAGASPLTVFYCQDAFKGDEAPSLLARLRQTPTDLVAVSSDVMDALSGRELSQGIVATFALLEPPFESLALSGRELVLILDRLQDPGNLGTLIRTADASGVAAVILIEPCVDPFDPKTVRASMGSLFNVPVVRMAEPADLLIRLRRQGFRLIGADAHVGTPWGQGLWQGGVALALGNEVQGLSDRLRSQVDAWVRLPIAGKAESLNVAVAGGILMYTWLRENRLA